MINKTEAEKTLQKILEAREETIVWLRNTHVPGVRLKLRDAIGSLNDAVFDLRQAGVMMGMGMLCYPSEDEK